MILKFATRALIMLAVLAPVMVFADASADLMKVETAFQNAKSYHVEEHFSNGRTVTVDYSAPDRWRIQPNPNITELVIGNDVYMVSKGRATKLPFGGMMVRKIIQHVGFSARGDIQRSARDLGMQTVGGQPVHAYSYTTHGTPVTLYVGANSLPVQSIVQDKKLTTTITYSKYNQPISIEAP
jgi:hypothetical protein